MEREKFRERLSDIINLLKTLLLDENLHQILQEGIEKIVEGERNGLNKNDYDSQRENIIGILERIKKCIEILPPNFSLLLPENPLCNNPHQMIGFIEFPADEKENSLLLFLRLVAMKPNKIRFEPTTPFTIEIQFGIPKQENNRVHPTEIPLGIGIRFRRRNKEPVQHFFTFEIRNGRFKTIHQINIHLPPDIQIQLEALGRTLRKVIETVYFPQSL